MSLGSSREKDRLDQNKQKVLERRHKKILKDVTDLHLLSDLLPRLFVLFFLVNDHSLWSYSKALAGREIHPFCGCGFN